MDILPFISFFALLKQAINNVLINKYFRRFGLKDSGFFQRFISIRQIRQDMAYKVICY